VDLPDPGRPQVTYKRPPRPPPTEEARSTACNAGTGRERVTGVPRPRTERVRRPPVDDRSLRTGARR
jgi:hypothetical protein